MSISICQMPHSYSLCSKSNFQIANLSLSLPRGLGPSEWRAGQPGVWRYITGGQTGGQYQSHSDNQTSCTPSSVTTNSSKHRLTRTMTSHREAAALPTLTSHHHHSVLGVPPPPTSHSPSITSSVRTSAASAQSR